MTKKATQILDESTEEIRSTRLGNDFGNGVIAKISITVTRTDDGYNAVCLMHDGNLPAEAYDQIVLGVAKAKDRLNGLHC